MIKSLDDILALHLQDIRAGHDGKLKQAIVEAVEGLIPGPAKPKTDYDKGWNDCLNTVLQAIKEWQ